MTTTPAKLHARFSTLDYLDQIPLAAIEQWSPLEREAAERWAHEWDLWTSDVSDRPLSAPPAVLRAFLPSDFC
jgi:hypothetical protein